MATKAERFKSDEIQRARAPRNASPRRRAPRGKPHNLGKRAARNAVVQYDRSKKPSRKSTRKSRHRQRPVHPLERRQTMREVAPEARAARASAKAVTVRGKPSEGRGKRSP